MYTQDSETDKNAKLAVRVGRWSRGRISFIVDVGVASLSDLFWPNPLSDGAKFYTSFRKVKMLNFRGKLL